jgi:hypothetical protein
VARRSIHTEPIGVAATARHYLRDLTYGANDGIITTFAVVAGVAGGALSLTAVLVIGAANLAADGLSMAVGNFVAIRAHESARAADDLPEEEAHPGSMPPPPSPRSSRQEWCRSHPTSSVRWRSISSRGLPF